MTAEQTQPDMDAVGRVWSTQATVVRDFVEQRPKYVNLCEEVAYILRKRLKQKRIQVATVTSRAKSIHSFCEKITRKSYDDPLTEMTDLAGVRIVYLYKNDKPAIDNLIEQEFEVIEKVDKMEEKEADRFGYGALHYLVHLGTASSGARYEDLRKLTCEIQAGTVLQDAWAIIAHHLSYKQESAVPKSLRRKLNSLSGLFETADDQFDRLREEREAYVTGIMAKVSNKEQFLRRDIDLDILTQYLSTRFPDRGEVESQTASELLGDLQEAGYNRLAQLDEALTRSEKAFLAFEKSHPPGSKKKVAKPPSYGPIGCTRISLSIMDDAFLEVRNRKGQISSPSRYTDFRGMIEK